MLCLIANIASFMLRIIGEICLLALLCGDSQQKTNKYGPSPKYIFNSNNLSPGNNYIPPNGPTNQYFQPNYMTNPVNSNYPYPQQNAIPNQGNPYPQQNLIPNQDNPYPQQNLIPNQGNPYPQQNLIPKSR